jgi:hypothetical protein
MVANFIDEKMAEFSIQEIIELAVKGRKTDDLTNKTIENNFRGAYSDSKLG